MDREEIYVQLNEVFREVFGDDTLTVDDETTAKDVPGWDSLMHITLISEVEAAFGMRFSMRDVLGMKNVGEMVDRIEEAV